MPTYVRSRADLVSGAVTLLVGGHDPETARLVGLARDDPSEEYKWGLLAFTLEHYRSVLAHEWAHILQLATYPYLLFRAGRQAEMSSAFLRSMQRHPGPIDLPLTFALTRGWGDSQVLDRVPARVTFDDNGSQLMPVQQDAIARGSLTERDIVEEAAQIFQYQAEIGSRGNGPGYQRWLREPGRYTLAFTLVARQLGAESAYRMLPVLTRVAFSTTIPLSAFAGAVAQCKTLPEELFDWGTRNECGILLSNILRRTWDTVDLCDVGMLRPEIEDPEGVLTEDALAALVPRVKKLPVSLLAAEDLLAEAEGRTTISAFMDEPWRYWPRGALPDDDVAVELLPPGIVLQLFDDSFPSGASVMWVSPLLSRTPFPDAPGGSYGDWFRELYRARMATVSMLEPVLGPHPSCPHNGCRFHATGLCRAWFPVPKSNADECQFPGWLQVTTGRDVNLDGSQLVSIDPARPATE